MLVLSRKEHEKFIFANLGVTVEIVRVSGSTVRVGIDAPPEIAIVREEIADQQTLTQSRSASRAAPAITTHRLRNRLNTATLALKLMHKQLAAGMTQAAEETLQKALDAFELLDQELGANAKCPTPAPRRALLVEDDKNECELLAGILRMSGYEVDTAHDGLEALDYLASHRPDFVLLDMGMPRCDGSATIAAIRRDPQLRGLKVFAVSGSSQRELGITTGERGVDRWFEKPLDPQRLLGEMSKQAAETCAAV
jgi:carbon storage regulator CsrA